MNIGKPRHYGASALIELAQRMAVTVTWFEVLRVVIGHDGELVCVVIPQVVTATQATEPEVIAFISDNRYGINVTIVLFIRAINNADACANGPLFGRVSGANGRGDEYAQCQKFEFGHNPFFPVVK
ncbi:hypothetical protein D3C85_1401920 [compost metagenome]